MGASVERFDFTRPEAREAEQRFGPGELAVIGTPVYAGRVPNVLLKYLTGKLRGSGALAIPVVLFGNRNFDDGLIELRNILEQDGLRAVAGAAFVGEHSFSRTLAAGRPDKRLPRDEWTVVENTHEPIISREDFDAVQAICVERNAAYRARLGKYDHLGKRENILKGLVYCSDCGRTMVRYKQVSHGKNVSYYYLCPSYAAMLEQSGCSYKFLPEDFLLDSLEQVIQKEIEQAVDMTALAKRLSARVSGKTDQGAMMLKKLNAQLERVEETRRNAMRDYLGGQMEQTDYELLKECCLGEAEELKKQIFDLREQQRYQAETLTEKNPWLAAFGGLGRPFHLTKELAASLIERVTIYGNNRVEILLRFRDEREQLLAAAGEEEAV